MQMVREVKIFKNGKNQAIRIPKDFELPGDRAILRKVGHKLILEPVAPSLLWVLDRLEPVDEEFPDVDEGLLPLDDVEL